LLQILSIEKNNKEYGPFKATNASKHLIDQSEERILLIEEYFKALVDRGQKY